VTPVSELHRIILQTYIGQGPRMQTRGLGVSALQTHFILQLDSRRRPCG